MIVDFGVSKFISVSVEPQNTIREDQRDAKVSQISDWNLQ